MPHKKRALILQHIIENPAGRVGVVLDEYEPPFTSYTSAGTIYPTPSGIRLSLS